VLTIFEAGCSAVKPACAVVDVAHAACEYVTVEYLDADGVARAGDTLAKLQSELGAAALVSVSCARLIRVDFIAAGDLLNWVLARRGEGRTVSFVDLHRLLALFFGAMGINEHARVQVRKV
jgi:hypothetical protein